METKVISNAKIAPAVIDVIKKSKQYIILVSPYLDFMKWGHFTYELKKALNNNIKVYLYIRSYENNKNSSFYYNLGFLKELVVGDLNDHPVIIGQRGVHEVQVGYLSFQSVGRDRDLIADLEGFVNQY